MSRLLLFAVAFSAAVFNGAHTSHGIVLVNDTWKDGTRTDPLSPDYTENGVDLDHDGDIESAWFHGGAGSFDVVGAGGPLRNDLTSFATTQSSLTTYFAPEATPVTLDVGQKLKVTFVFTPTLLESDGIDMTGQSFRMAVVNTPSIARISTDVNPPQAAYSGYGAFINMQRPTFDAADGMPFELRERVNPTPSGGPLLSSQAAYWSVLGNGATNGNPSFTSGTQYTYTFEATHTAADELAMVSRLSGTGFNGTGFAEVDYTDTTPNGGSFSFDTFTLRLNSGYQTAGILDISLFKVEVLSAVAPLVGDVNFDGIVNGQDIALVASNWLLTGDAPGDANDDGIVNGQDIAIIASNWLATSGPGNAATQSAAVPEPGGLALLVTGLMWDGILRLRRRRHLSI